MRSFGISIKGRTKNFTLPKSQPLIPLFEAIVNSFHSIEERKKADRSFTDGRILIEFERDGQMMLDGDGSISEINNMIVTDNGSGFDEIIFHLFLSQIRHIRKLSKERASAAFLGYTLLKRRRLKASTLMGIHPSNAPLYFL